MVFNKIDLVPEDDARTGSSGAQSVSVSAKYGDAYGRTAGGSQGSISSGMRSPRLPADPLLRRVTSAPISAKRPRSITMDYRADGTWFEVELKAGGLPAPQGVRGDRVMKLYSTVSAARRARNRSSKNQGLSHMSRRFPTRARKLRRIHRIDPKKAQGRHAQCARDGTGRQNADRSGASDDGEPQGTSGAPIVQMLVAQGITNVVVVVTRYFGGIKLGTGGLVRAYTSSAKLGTRGGGRLRCLRAAAC